MEKVSNRMNSRKDIDQKIVRVLNGAASDPERREVVDWVRESESNSFQFDHLKKFWNQSSNDLKLIGHEEQKKRIWKTYVEESQKDRTVSVKPLFRWTWSKVAAVIAVLLLPAYLVINGTEDIVVETKPELEVINKKNPTGQKSQIQLPDGSKAWLNSDSQISYVETFSDSIRSLRLEGEAYFEVVHDSLRPFIVESATLSVTVLGTAFNIHAFQEEKEVKVTLVDGSVKVTASENDLTDNLILSSGTGIIYSKEEKKYSEFSRLSNPGLFSKATGWRNGILVFDGSDFDGFVREITRWYGIQVKIEGTPPKNWDIMASFENELLTNIMDAISYNKGFHYRLKDKELTIMFH